MVGKIATLFLLNLICASLALAEPHDDYLKFSNKYYLLDEQDFASITCKVRVSSVNNLLEQIRQQMAALPKAAEIEENLSDFSLTYRKGKGLEFKRPYFDIKVLSDEEVKNKELFYIGIEQMKNGFNGAIAGTENTIQGIFEEFMTPEVAKEKIISFVESGGEAKVSLEDREGMRYDALYKGNMRFTEFNNPQMKGRSEDRYENLEGRLFLVESNIQMELLSGFQTIKTNFTIDYQKIKDLSFPKKIATHSVQSIGSVSQEVTTDIFFEGCSVE